MRCKACNSVLEEYEVYWNPTAKQMEDLCSTCRSSIATDENVPSEEVFDVGRGHRQDRETT